MDEAAFREGVRTALAARLEPRRSDTAPSVLGAGNDDLARGRAYLAALAPTGLAVPTWPAAYGGIDASPRQAQIVAEESARFERPDLYPFLVGLALVGPVLLAHGSPEQHARWLAPIASGTEIWCQLFSEPGAGSDLASLSTQAVRDGDIWRVAGSKVWSSRAHYSRWGLLLARTDRDAPKHDGITAFGLDMHTHGVDVRPLRQMNGDTHFSEVFLDDVEVPDADRIDAPGRGWTVARTTLMHERGAVGGGGLVSRDQLLALARARGRADDAVTRQRLASIITGLEVGKWTALRARAGLEAGRAPGPEGSGAKLRMSRTLQGLADVAAGIRGVDDRDDEWRTLFLTGPSLSIRGGTDEIQKNILGERVLGLPRDPEAGA